MKFHKYYKERKLTNMICPNCQRKMQQKSGIWHFINEDDGELKYYCNTCKITYSGNKWSIPTKFLPTVKQKRTIIFINNRLHLGLQAITKRQCWLDIGKYFAEAKKKTLHSNINSPNKVSV